MLLTGVFIIALLSLQAQSVPAQQPVEEQYHISSWWWTLGVLLAIAGGVILYMLVKKDPKRDAVR